LKPEIYAPKSPLSLSSLNHAVVATSEKKSDLISPNTPLITRALFPLSREVVLFERIFLNHELSQKNRRKKKIRCSNRSVNVFGSFIDLGIEMNDEIRKCSTKFSSVDDFESDREIVSVTVDLCDRCYVSSSDDDRDRVDDEGVRAKISYLAERNEEVRVHFKLDLGSGAIGDIASVYEKVDVKPVIKEIYESLVVSGSDDDSLESSLLWCKNVVPVLKDSPYWDGEVREDIGGSNDGHRQHSFTRRFDRVCVGGTFDHAHAGHRMLLATAVAVCKQRLDVGVTSDKVLENKKFREHLETYEKRVKFCERFVKLASPETLECRIGELDDSWPIAATSEDVDALVISKETLEGAEKINEERKRRGFEPVVLVICDVLGSGSKRTIEDKLSSTKLRELEAKLALAKDLDEKL